MKLALPSAGGIRLDRVIDDFRDLNPNDPGVWPLLPRLVVSLAVFIAAVAAGWWFDWKGQFEALEQSQQEEVRLKEEWLNKKRQAINLDEYRKQLAEIDRQFGALLKQLPNKSEMESLLIDVNQAGRGRGLQFEYWKPGQETPKEFYAEMPIAISVTSGYHDLGQFASDVAKLPRIVTLRDISVSAQDTHLKMDATAVTYRYLDEEEIAQQKRDKTKSTK
jgi:type IV pilus assembly protein PilO